MELIQAIPTQLDIVAALERQCFHRPWTAQTLGDALADERYIVLLIKEGENICGFALGWSIGEEAELARVGILPHWRNRLLGEQITRAICEMFKERGAESVFLEVREDNTSARRLYDKCGFIEIGRRNNYYDDGQTAVVMRLECV